MSKDYSVSDTQWSKPSTAATEIRTASKVTQLKSDPIQCINRNIKGCIISDFCILIACAFKPWDQHSET